MSDEIKVVVSNKTFAGTNDLFIKACEKAGVPATKRQASKFKRGFGLAYKFRKEV